MNVFSGASANKMSIISVQGSVIYKVRDRLPKLGKEQYQVQIPEEHRA